MSAFNHSEVFNNQCIAPYTEYSVIIDDWTFYATNRDLSNTAFVECSNSWLIMASHPSGDVFAGSVIMDNSPFASENGVESSMIDISNGCGIILENDSLSGSVTINGKTFALTRFQ